MTRLANGDWSYEAAVRRLLQDDGRHPAPHWCPQCGRLDCTYHHGATWAPTVTPRPTRDEATVNRTRRYRAALARITRNAA